MFDLIEEDLAKKDEPQVASETENMQSPQLGEIAVSVMPERFRPVIKKKKKGSMFMVMIVVLFVFIAVASIVALIVLSQPQKQKNKTTEQQASVDQAVSQPVAQESATSTPSTVEQIPPVTPSALPEQQPVAPQEKPLPASADQAPTSSDTLMQGTDSDGDQLTDAEERMYGTDSSKPDTDGDGFFDGEELKKLFDPTKSTSSRLDVSVLTHSYTNQPFKYRVLYPAAWVAKAVNATEREVIFTSATGEFISLTVDDNPQGLTPLDWYITAKEPGINPSQLQTITGDTWLGVVSTDGRSIFISRKSEKGTSASAQLMYTLSYNLNTKNEVNFLITFQMMMKSFTFTDLTFIK